MDGWRTWATCEFCGYAVDPWDAQPREFYPVTPDDDDDRQACGQCVQDDLNLCDCCHHFTPVNQLTNHAIVDYGSAKLCDQCSSECSQLHCEIRKPIERRLRNKRGECAVCNEDRVLLEDGTMSVHSAGVWLSAIDTCKGSLKHPFKPPTKEELAGVYRSLGVEPPPEEGA